MFSPAILAFDVEADLQVCAVNTPASILASFIVFLIHLAIASLGTGLNGFVVEIKSAGSDDLVNFISSAHHCKYSQFGIKRMFWICTWELQIFAFDNNWLLHC